MSHKPSAYITKVKNGFTVELGVPVKDNEFFTEEYIYATKEEAIGAVVKYFDD